MSRNLDVSQSVGNSMSSDEEETKGSPKAHNTHDKVNAWEIPVSHHRANKGTHPVWGAIHTLDTPF